MANINSPKSSEKLFIDHIALQARSDCLELSSDCQEAAEFCEKQNLNEDAKLREFRENTFSEMLKPSAYKTWDLDKNVHAYLKFCLNDKSLVSRLEGIQKVIDIAKRYFTKKIFETTLQEINTKLDSLSNKMEKKEFDSCIVSINVKLNQLEDSDREFAQQYSPQLDSARARLQQICHASQTPQPHPQQPQQTSPEIEMLVANKNQFNAIGTKGIAACGPIAAEVVVGLLQNRIDSPKKLDAYIEQGIVTYKTILAEVNKATLLRVKNDAPPMSLMQGIINNLLSKNLSELSKSDVDFFNHRYETFGMKMPPPQLFLPHSHLSWDHILPALENRLEPARGINLHTDRLTLISGAEKKTYQGILRNLQDLTLSLKEPVGAVLLIGDSFFSLAVHPKTNNEVVFFIADSHASHMQQNAWIAKTTSLDKAAEVLKDRKSIPSKAKSQQIEYFPLVLSEQARQNHILLAHFAFQNAKPYTAPAPAISRNNRPSSSSNILDILKEMKQLAEQKKGPLVKAKILLLPPAIQSNLTQQVKSLTSLPLKDRWIIAIDDMTEKLSK